MIPPNQLWPLDQARANLVLPPRISEALAALRDLGRDDLAATLGEPSALHRTLYHDLTPIEHPEFAGNFRGSAFPTLRHCQVASALTHSEDSQGS